MATSVNDILQLIDPAGTTITNWGTGLDFDGDPADELIAATSVVHGVPLLTRDRKIRTSKLVPLA